MLVLAWGDDPGQMITWFVFKVVSKNQVFFTRKEKPAKSFSDVSVEGGTS